MQMSSGCPCSCIDKQLNECVHLIACSSSSLHTSLPLTDIQYVEHTRFSMSIKHKQAWCPHHSNGDSRWVIMNYNIMTLIKSLLYYTFGVWTNTRISTWTLKLSYEPTVQQSKNKDIISEYELVVFVNLYLCHRVVSVWFLRLCLCSLSSQCIEGNANSVFHNLWCWSPWLDFVHLKSCINYAWDLFQVRKWIKSFLFQWTDIPVWVHLFGDDREDNRETSG